MTLGATRRPNPGDVYVFRRADGRLGACRVIRTATKEEEALLGEPAVLVYGCAWTGSEPPHLQDPLLREVAVWTHGAWKNHEDVAFITGPLPRSLRRIGALVPTPEEIAAKRALSQKTWHFMGPWAPPPVAPRVVSGTIRLERYHGVEEFAVKSAEVLATTGDAPGRTSLHFESVAKLPALRRALDEEEELEGTNVGAEACFDIDEVSGLDELVGRTFVDPGGEESDATFSYHETESFEDVRVCIEAREGDLLTVLWTGTTVDVNYYDGSKPPTRVTIRSSFTFEDRS